MADEYNRLAMYSMPIAGDEVINYLDQNSLPTGHPSNMLRSLRDMIPQIQADDTSTMSGITSRVGRTATAIPRGALETMANWLQGTHNPNAVRIGEDTIAPLGLFSMGAGMANAGARAARGSYAVEQPNPVHFSSRYASIFDPPTKPQRPFEADYPQGAPTDAAGRLTHDIDGRPLTARYVVGRREDSGPDVALSREALDEIATARTGAPIREVAPGSAELGRDVGRAVFGRDGRPDSVYISSSLSDGQSPRVAGHEIGHVIDVTAGKIPTNGLNAELRSLYNTLNNLNRSRDGTEAATWGKPATPQAFGYRSDDIGREHMAEAIRAYMADPNYLKTVAPKTAARIREHVNANPALNRTIQFNDSSASASSPGLAASASQQPQDDAVMSILSRYGLLAQ